MASEDILYGDLSPRKKVTYDPDSMYNMGGDKLVFTFNHKTFQKTRHFRCAQSARPETDQDVARLRKTFESIGFKVEKPCNDFTHDQILKKLQDVCEMDHRNTSCVAFVFLTHGGAGGQVNAADRPYAVSDVVNRVLHAPNLAGKPKLFFAPVTTPGAKPKSCEISLACCVESSRSEIEKYVEIN